jgi:hypothetical protein
MRVACSFEARIRAFRGLRQLRNVGLELLYKIMGQAKRMQAVGNYHLECYPCIQMNARRCSVVHSVHYHIDIITAGS